MKIKNKINWKRGLFSFLSLGTLISFNMATAHKVFAEINREELNTIYASHSLYISSEEIDWQLERLNNLIAATKKTGIVTPDALSALGGEFNAHSKIIALDNIKRQRLAIINDLKEFLQQYLDESTALSNANLIVNHAIEIAESSFSDNKNANSFYNIEKQTLKDLIPSLENEILKANKKNTDMFFEYYLDKAFNDNDKVWGVIKKNASLANEDITTKLERDIGQYLGGEDEEKNREEMMDETIEDFLQQIRSHTNLYSLEQEQVAAVNYERSQNKNLLRLIAFSGNINEMTKDLLRTTQQIQDNYKKQINESLEQKFDQWCIARDFDEQFKENIKTQVLEAAVLSIESFGIELESEYMRQFYGEYISLREQLETRAKSNRETLAAVDAGPVDAELREELKKLKNKQELNISLIDSFARIVQKRPDAPVVTLLMKKASARELRKMIEVVEANDRIAAGNSAQEELLQQMRTRIAEIENS
ncbi:MAG: hypothetical protein HQK53_15500 [Oligoflexia bacterium]|nr:hypothetical protein [Oligoflexia bacterium]